MATKVEVETLLKLRDEVSKNSRRIDKALQQNAKSAKRAKTSIGGLQVKYLALAAALAAANRVFGAALKANAVQVRAVNSLNLALANQGNLLEGTSARLQEYASALQTTTAFGDEEIIAAQALLASFGQNEEQIKQTTVAVLDFAAAAGTDLTAAVNLVGKAFVGETGSLSRYGIIVDKNIPKTQKFDAVLAQLTTRFGGAAAAQTEDFAGQLQQVSNAVGDLQEKMGAFIGFLATDANGSIDTFLANLKLLEIFFGQVFPVVISEAHAQLLEFSAGVREVVVGLVEAGSKLPTAAFADFFAGRPDVSEIAALAQAERDLATSIRESADAYVLGGVSATNYAAVQTAAAAATSQASAATRTLVSTARTATGATIGLGHAAGITLPENLALAVQAEADANQALIIHQNRMIMAGIQVANLGAEERKLGEDARKAANEAAAAWIKSDEERQKSAEFTNKFLLGGNIDVVAGTLQSFGELGSKFKALAIAGAIIATYSSIAKALAFYVWPFNLVAAAGAAAAGFANVNKIRSSEPGFQEGTPRLDFQNFGNESRVAVHGREAIIPRGGGHQLAGEIASGLGGVGGNADVVNALKRIEAMLPDAVGRAVRDHAQRGFR